MFKNFMTWSCVWDNKFLSSSRQKNKKNIFSILMKKSQKKKENIQHGNNKEGAGVRNHIKTCVVCAWHTICRYNIWKEIGKNPSSPAPILLKHKKIKFSFAEFEIKKIDNFRNYVYLHIFSVSSTFFFVVQIYWRKRGLIAFIILHANGRHRTKKKKKFLPTANLWNHKR